MKFLKQLLLYLFLVIVLGMTNAFLLYEIQYRKVYEPNYFESKLPERLQTETMDNPIIRVLIKTTGFKTLMHKKVEVSAEGGLRIIKGDEVSEHKSDEMLQLENQNGLIRIEPLEEGNVLTIHSIERGYGSPSYRGFLDVYSTEEGFVIVNEVLLEEYLCAVVPSEMPASYELESLKAQAICARSYAHNQTKELSYPKYSAHVDDSVSFQVYNNSKEQETTTRAVVETAGEKLWYGDEVAMTYFYSTSSGDSTSVEAWGTKLVEQNQYLKGVSISDSEGKDYEEKLAWYRWNAVVSESVMEGLIESHTEMEIGTLKNIEITRRGTGNVALELAARGTEGTVTVTTENAIRRALGGTGYQITKQDGNIIDSMELLPSAFITIEKSGTDYIINGGGYGHGIGMSQNGANELAKDGKSYIDILTFFYPGTKVE